MKQRRKFVSGRDIGQRRKITYCCELCDLIQPGTKKPAQCIEKSCGSMAFFTFDSRAEANRYASLRIREKRGEITNLRRQVPFDLLACDTSTGKILAKRVGKYISDFVYEVLPFEDKSDGYLVIEDVKPRNLIDPLAAWKHRHMEAQGNPVTIYEAH